MFCVFVGCLPGITQPGCLRRLKSKVRGRGGKGHNQLTPPGPRLAMLNSGNDLLSTLSTTVYSVLQRLTRDFGRTNTVSISGCLTGYVTRQAVTYRFHK